MTNPSFNLVTEKWIPLIDLKGKAREASIEETITNPKEFREIMGQSPLETPAITRLLLAILHRNFGPATKEEWVDIWESGSWNRGVLKKYLDDWKHRFDLFDEKAPFYQIPGIVFKKKTPINKLSHEIAAGNNAVLFDHNRDDLPISTSPSQAARLLITFQSYAVGGGKSETGYTKNATLVNGANVMLKGSNLFETFMLNMVEYDGTRLPIPGKNDGPCWEQEAVDHGGSTRLVRGYLDYLTWKSRALRLLPTNNNDGNLIIKHAYVAQGTEIKDEILRDSMKSYRIDKDRGRLTIRVTPKTVMWRNLPSLLMIKDKGFETPLSFEMIADLVFDGVLDRSRMFNIEVIGLSTDKAKIHTWGRSNIPLPAQYLKEKELVLDLADAVEQAEVVQKLLRKGIWALAANLADDKDSRSNITDSLDPSGAYWSELEVHFYEFIGNLVDVPSNIVQEEHRVNTKHHWLNTVRDISTQIVEKTFNGMAGNGRNLKAVTAASDVFFPKMLSYVKKETEKNG